MTISVTDTATGTELTVTEVRAALDTDTPLLAAIQKEREGKPVATWDQFDEGLTELRRRLIDGLGEADAVLSTGQPEPEPEPPSFPDAVLPDEPDPVAAYMAAADPDPRPGRWVNVAEDDLLPARIVRVGRNPLEQAYAEREARGWTPDPADYGPRPAIHRGPRNGLLARLDGWLQRTEQWWRDREARRDERMGAP